MDLIRGFNTQPPEGGWELISSSGVVARSFNTQPPEGGWFTPGVFRQPVESFNTQPPEGGWVFLGCSYYYKMVSTHSRLKAAGTGGPPLLTRSSVSTHSRLKAAGSRNTLQFTYSLCFNTQPPEGGWLYRRIHVLQSSEFQHTAA